MAVYSYQRRIEKRDTGEKRNEVLLGFYSYCSALMLVFYYFHFFSESGEEREDVKKSYENHKGDMGKIMNDIIGVSFEDEDRIRNMINEMIENGELKLTKSFVNESRQKRAKRQKAAKKEAKVWCFLSRIILFIVILLKLHVRKLSHSKAEISICY